MWLSSSEFFSSNYIKFNIFKLAYINILFWHLQLKFWDCSCQYPHLIKCGYSTSSAFSICTKNWIHQSVRMVTPHNHGYVEATDDYIIRRCKYNCIITDTLNVLITLRCVAFFVSYLCYSTHNLGYAFWILSLN